MEYEMEITERLRDSIIDTVKQEMARGWSLEHILPMLHNAVDDAIEEMEEE